MLSRARHVVTPVLLLVALTAPPGVEAASRCGDATSRAWRDTHLSPDARADQLLLARPA